MILKLALQNKMADTINAKVVCFSREANPLLDEEKAEMWQTSRGTNQTKGKTLKPTKFFSQESKMWDGKCNILQHSGTNGKTRNMVYKEAF
jgi:hypothetical protein